MSEREREHTIQPWPSQTTRSRPAPVHHPPSIAQRIIRHPEEGPSIGGAEWVTDAVPSHPHPIRSCRSKPIMPVSMRAPDGRVFVGERVRRVSGEDIRGDARARWPHRVLYESPTAIPTMEPMPVLRDALLYCCTQQQRRWRTSSNHLRTAEHDVNVAPDTVAVLWKR